MIRLEIKNCNMILRKKQQKISALSSEKIDQHKYVTVEKILPFDRIRVIEQTKFTYSPFKKSFRKTNKNN